MHMTEYSRRSFLAAGTAAFAGSVIGIAGTEQFKAGIVEVSITPDWSVPLGGYGIRSSTGVLDEIHAKAFLFEYDKRFLLLTMDIEAFGYSFYKKAVDAVAAAITIDKSAIAVTCIHSHAAPTVLPMRTINPDPLYEEFLVDKLVQVAQEAELNLQPAGVSYGRTDSYIGVNRRTEKRISDWNLLSGSIDSNLDVLLFASSSGTPLGLLVCYGVHPVTLRDDNSKISADFVSFVYSELQRELHCPIGYIQGACGEVIPKIFGTYTESEIFGKRLAADVRSALQDRVQVHNPSVSYRTDLVNIPLHAPYTREEFRSLYKTMMNTTKSHYMQEWARDYYRYLDKGGSLTQTHETVVQSLRIGDVCIALLPNHLLHLTSLKIKDTFPSSRIIVSIFANDMAAGYLPPAEEYLKGKYEVESSWKYYGLLQPPPEAEQLIRETAIRQILELLE